MQTWEDHASGFVREGIPVAASCAYWTVVMSVALVLSFATLVAAMVFIVQAFARV